MHKQINPEIRRQLAAEVGVNEQYLYCDIPEEVTHFTDTLERAIEIGDCKLCKVSAYGKTQFLIKRYNHG